MSEQAGHETASAARAQHSAPTRTGWAGWVYFGGTMLILAGTFNLVEGLVALFNDQYYVPTRQGLLVFDITGWGWIHLIIGALAVIIGIGLFAGAMWARVSGVILAGLNALAQLAFLSAYPLWAAIVIAIDILIIWALIVHGDEVKFTEDW